MDREIEYILRFFFYDVLNYKNAYIHYTAHLALIYIVCSTYSIRHFFNNIGRRTNVHSEI